MRALCTWSWLVATTGTALMLAPHLPLIAAQAVAHAVRNERGEG